MDLEELKNRVDGCKNMKIDPMLMYCDDLANLIDRCEKAEAKLSEMEKQAPAKYEFKCQDGNWYGFDSDKHYRNTVDSGEFEIRKLYALPVPQQSEWQSIDTAPKSEDVERWLNEFAIWFFNTVPASLSAYSRNEGRWISDDIEMRWQSYLNDRKSLWNSMIAISQHTPIQEYVIIKNT